MIAMRMIRINAVDSLGQCLWIEQLAASSFAAARRPLSLCVSGYIASLKISHDIASEINSLMKT
jgi:hypothetical protein